ncbi:MAG: hypothetical protein H7831_08195 [Magnetococcus sp. WYHC-3]
MAKEWIDESLEGGKEGEKIEGTPRCIFHIEPEYKKFIPREFFDEPIEYFETHGTNIKPGEPKFDEEGELRDDPTAVKVLPDWSDDEGKKIQVVAKKVNIKKGKVAESGDPFHEYRIMVILNKIGLPSPKPIARVESDDGHLIVMEKVSGLNPRDVIRLRDEGKISQEDLEKLLIQAESKIEQLKELFDEVGIIRNWHVKDMVVEIDFETMTITKLTPVDWERTKIDEEKLRKYKEKINID